jgi:UDP-N-acetylmuramyl pentapeptide phosphotransferase/UDP-N-acetylglucosamine-1-phosphate transferase
MFIDPPIPISMIWLTALVLSFALCGFFTWYTRYLGMVDIPDQRHSHITPTARGGGAGIILSLLLMTAYLLRVIEPMPFWTHCLVPAVSLLALIGWWDDRVSLSASLRFFVQLAVTLYLLWCMRSQFPTGAVFWYFFAGGFLLWMTNLYNFMDGSNGMAGAQGVFAGLLLSWLFLSAGDNEAALYSSLISAACLGFLPWNLGKARVFMGDVASGALGFAFASLLIYGVVEGRFSLPVAWLLMLLFIIDSTLTLLFRVMKGERWYNPHKQHLYQRLIARGWSHGSVLLLYQLVNLVLVIPAIVVAVNSPEMAWVVSFVLTLGFGLSWAFAIKKIGVLASAG